MNPPLPLIRNISRIKLATETRVFKRNQSIIKLTKKHHVHSNISLSLLENSQKADLTFSVPNKELKPPTKILSNNAFKYRKDNLGPAQVVQL